MTVGHRSFIYDRRSQIRLVGYRKNELLDARRDHRRKAGYFSREEVEVTRTIITQPETSTSWRKDLTPSTTRICGLQFLPSSLNPSSHVYTSLDVLNLTYQYQSHHWFPLDGNRGHFKSELASYGSVAAKTTARTHRTEISRSSDNLSHKWASLYLFQVNYSRNSRNLLLTRLINFIVQLLITDSHYMAYRLHPY